MSLLVSVPTSIVSALGPDDLGIYVKGKALLDEGKSSFTLRELGGDKEAVRIIINHLMELQYVSYSGGGRYALAKKPNKSPKVESQNLADKMTAASVKVKTPKLSSSTYCDALIAASINAGYNISSRAYTPTTQKNKPRFRRIIKVVYDAGSTPEQFAKFVFLQDWQWCKDPFPPLGVFSTDEFLTKFIWFIENKAAIGNAALALRIFDASFKIKVRRLYSDFLLLSPLIKTLSENNITISDYIRYLKTLPWTLKGNVPALRYITTQEAIARFMGTIATSYVNNSTGYLNKVLTLLNAIPTQVTASTFEDLNWTVAEAILEPLAAHMNGSSGILTDQLRIVRSNKAADSLGFYLITHNGTLTPLAVHWLLFASSHIPTNFYSGTDWKDAIKAKASAEVKLSVFDQNVETIT